MVVWYSLGGWLADAREAKWLPPLNLQPEDAANNSTIAVIALPVEKDELAINNLTNNLHSIRRKGLSIFQSKQQSIDYAWVIFLIKIWCAVNFILILNFNTL